MQATPQKLNKTIIDSTPLPPTGPTRLHDRGARGLHLRSSAGGTRTWYLTYRTESNVQRDLKIGRYPDVGPDAARSKALVFLGEIATGKDPASQKRTAGSQPTVADLADRFLSEHVTLKLKPSTRRHYSNAIRLHIKPRLGRVRVADLTKADVARMSFAMSASPRQANHAVAVVSSMMRCAIDWRLRTDGINPATAVKKYPERRRNRYLSQTELQRLWKVLEDETARNSKTDAALAFKLAILTGRRIGEVLNLRWGDLDLAAGLMRLQDSKVGAMTFHLSPEVGEMLQEIRESRDREATDDDLVVRGKQRGKPFAGIENAWQRIREAADLPDVRIHDLRHSYASFAAADGCDLLRIKEMLGHRTIQTTQRYAHLSSESIRSSVSEVGASIHRIANG